MQWGLWLGAVEAVAGCSRGCDWVHWRLWLGVVETVLDTVEIVTCCNEDSALLSAVEIMVRCSGGCD